MIVRLSQPTDMDFLPSRQPFKTLRLTFHFSRLTKRKRIFHEERELFYHFNQQRIIMCRYLADKHKQTSLKFHTIE